MDQTVTIKGAIKRLSGVKKYTLVNHPLIKKILLGLTLLVQLE